MLRCWAAALSPSRAAASRGFGRCGERSECEHKELVRRIRKAVKQLRSAPAEVLELSASDLPVGGQWLICRSNSGHMGALWWALAFLGCFLWHATAQQLTRQHMSRQPAQRQHEHAAACLGFLRAVGSRVLREGYCVTLSGSCADDVFFSALVGVLSVKGPSSISQDRRLRGGAGRSERICERSGIFPHAIRPSRKVTILLSRCPVKCRLHAGHAWLADPAARIEFSFRVLCHATQVIQQSSQPRQRHCHGPRALLAGPAPSCGPPAASTIPVSSKNRIATGG